ncbi:hypothetical protein Tco_0767355 [Tanacetum coccineum]
MMYHYGHSKLNAKVFVMQDDKSTKKFVSSSHILTLAHRCELLIYLLSMDVNLNKEESTETSEFINFSIRSEYVAEMHKKDYRRKIFQKHQLKGVKDNDSSPKSSNYQNQDSHNSFSRQSHHDPNDPEKSLTKLNNDVKNDLEDFKRCIRSMRTVHWKLFARDDGKTTGVLPNKESKTVNQEPQSKTDLEKSITKFLDGQRVTNMFFKNNVNDMILKMKQNEKNFQTKIKNMERKIDEWSKSQNVSSKQTDRTNPPPPPQAQTEHVNAVFTGSGKSDYSLKIQKDPPPPIIVNNKSEKDRPIKTTKKGYHIMETNEYPFHVTYGLCRLFWNIGIGIKLYEWADNLVAPELVLDHHLLDRSEVHDMCRGRKRKKTRRIEA